MADLLSAERFAVTGTHVIAVHRDGDLTPADLARATAGIRSRLPARAAGDWAVLQSSPFQLLAALAALQSVGARAILLPHSQPELLARLAPDCEGFLSDRPLGLATEVVVSRSEALRGTPRRAEAPEPLWDQAIGLLTSGSSGEPACIFRTPDQLAREVAALEATFGAGIGTDRVFCGTTSHQHLFGFTFRVLWPYLTHRRLADQQIRIPGEVGAALRRFGKLVFVSSPAFLERARVLFDFPSLEASRFLGFCSGSPLAPAVAADFNRHRDVTLVEIYGSTETGALASRITAADRQIAWRPLHGVTITRTDGLLHAQAPHLPEPGSWTTEDRIQLEADGFQLLGRRDRIAKVADKRVSLSQLETLLEAEAAVADASVVQLADGSLAAVVVPSDVGWQQLAGSGKSAFCGALRDRLCEAVERVTTPKRWRLVRQLPRDTQGKIGLETLRRLFDTAVPLPRWQAIEASDRYWRGVTTITPELDVLQGHFPDHPILPGVAQIHWAARIAREAFHLPPLPGHLKSVKFRHPIVPDAVLELTLSLSDSADAVRFEYRCGDRLCSSGRILTGDD